MIVELFLFQIMPMSKMIKGVLTAFTCLLFLSACAPPAVGSDLIPADTEGQSAVDLTDYAFPESIDPAAKYLFYLHGGIIEDQGLPAISPEFGEYEYENILRKFDSYGLTVISEQRGKDTDTITYARETAEQVGRLLSAGVPEKNITIVGASKGAGIAIYISNQLSNPNLNFVLLAICTPGGVKALVDESIALAGNVLSIYDSADSYADSCGELFVYSETKGLGRHEEIVLETGLGHGLLYRPLDEWVVPVILWAGKPGCTCAAPSDNLPVN